MSSSSSRTSASSRLRSRISGLLAAGSDHIFGSASLVSISESSLRMRAGSKILPQVAHLIANGSVSEFEIVQCHLLLGPVLVAKLASHSRQPISKSLLKGRQAARLIRV